MQFGSDGRFLEASSAVLSMVKGRGSVTLADKATGIPETLTVKETSQLLHCSTRQVQNLMYSGVLPFYKPSPRKCLIPVEAVQKLFEKPANAAVLKGGTE